MNKQRWLQIEELFHRASSLPTADRRAAIDAGCGDDADLRREVLSLLRSDGDVAELMADNAVLHPHGLERESAQDSSADSWIGHTVGAFVLERLLGRGGMGLVYLGRRREGDVAQTVAVKLIARHLRDSPAVDQFLSERRALAAMQHGNVARLLDGGIVDGVPYVAMEYVDGERLDTACDVPTCSLDRKIDLLLQLCDAVAYVHGQLILHRDIKPANVLVNRQGQVKLLDFGTLKRIDFETTESTMTRAGMRSMTLRYASPEHIAGRPVSVATDIFSLGMVAYRLLAGRLPPELDNLSISEYLHRLDTVELATPCAGLSGPPALRADLDAIVAKALRFAPSERYSSVSSLAQDLRHARASLPVSARGGSLAYRARTFCRRQRRKMAAGVLIACALIAGVFAVARQGAIAVSETRRAQAGLEDERRLAHLLLYDYFEELKRVPGSTDAQRRAVSHALKYLDDLANAGPDSALTLDRVDAYVKMGNLLGNPYEENIGDGGRAVETLTKAVGLARELLQLSGDDLNFLQGEAAALLALGRVHFGMGDPERAAASLRPAAAISQRIAYTPGVDSATIAQAASVVDALGDVLGQEGAVTLDDPAQAAIVYADAGKLDALGLEHDAACARCRRGVALEVWKRGMLTEHEDVEAAANLYRRGIDTLAGFSATEQATTRVVRLDTILRQRLGTMLLVIGQAAEALPLLADVHRRFASAVAADPMDTRARFDLAAFDGTLGEVYADVGRHDQSLASEEEFVQTMNYLVTRDPANKNWQDRRADGLLQLAEERQTLKVGSRAANEAMRREAVDAILRAAEQPEAEVHILQLAAQSLLEAHADPAGALTFAQRAASGKHPTPLELLTLAQAQQQSGHLVDARQTATAALQWLLAHPRSLGNAAQTVMARQLLAP